MEVDQIPCKFPKISNGSYASTIVSNKMSDEQGEKNQRRTKSSGGAAGPGGGIGWPSSRIVRVSRATGGKDRHSKVLTSRGLRDRRVRLSVNTAIEFYDLQDRLGYAQPSKAVEWLLAAAAASIAELPPVNPPFPLPDSAVAGKSSINSSSSETSKGSIAARSEKAVKEKEKEKEKSCYVASFTELLSGGGGSKDASDENSSFFPMDYFGGGGFSEVQPHFSFASDQSNNRGTLQSNSSQFPPKLCGGVNQRHFYPELESRLQLYYGGGDQGNGGGQKSKDKP